MRDVRISIHASSVSLDLLFVSPTPVWTPGQAVDFISERLEKTISIFYALTTI